MGIRGIWSIVPKKKERKENRRKAGNQGSKKKFVRRN